MDRDSYSRLFKRFAQLICCNLSKAIDSFSVCNFSLPKAWIPLQKLVAEPEWCVVAKMRLAQLQPKPRDSPHSGAGEGNALVACGAKIVWQRWGWAMIIHWSFPVSIQWSRFMICLEAIRRDHIISAVIIRKPDFANCMHMPHISLRQPAKQQVKRFISRLCLSATVFTQIWNDGN